MRSRTTRIEGEEYLGIEGLLSVGGLGILTGHLKEEVAVKIVHGGQTLNLGICGTTGWRATRRWGDVYWWR